MALSSPSSKIREHRWRLVQAVVGSIGILGLGLYSAAAEFDSYGVSGVTGGAIHGEITEDATKRLGINDCDDLQEAVRNPDWEQTSVIKFKLRPNDQYRASNHFDRMAGKSHEQAFKEGAYFVRTEYQKCVQLAKSGNLDASLASLGRTLHALQDLVSHSNLIDLSNAARVDVLAAIWDEAKAVPSELKITGYDTTAPDPGKPAGESFAHDDYSKDNPLKNDEAKKLINGQTKFKVAYALAVDVSQSVLVKLKSDLGDGWTALANKFD